MYPAQPSELLRSALSLLPPLPCSVEVLSPEGGSFALTLAAVEGNLVYAYGARKLVRDDLVHDVTEAQTEIRTQVNQAEQKKESRLSDAKAEVFQKVRLASAYAQEQRLQAEAHLHEQRRDQA